MSDELLVNYLLNEADAETRGIVEEWISGSDANRRYFEHFKLLWETSREIIVPPTVNSDEAWQRLRQRTYLAEPGKGKITSFNKYFRPLQVAASIILVLGLGALAYMFWNNQITAPVTYSSLDSSAIRELPDGSVVTLNKHSTITYAGKFSGDKRKVSLEGEAFFNVTPDKEKPFVVEVNGVTVTVLGTSFNIKSTNGITEVIVETGKVSVEKNNNTIILQPKEKVVVHQQDTALQKEKTTEKLYNYYRTQEFVCDNTPLWKLVEILNEAYEVNIIIENKELRNLPLTTTFYNEPLDNILSVISETFNISVDRSGDQVILK